MLEPVKPLRHGMKQPYFDNIQGLLAKEPALQQLVDQAVKLQHLQTLFDAQLDANLKPHCKVADFQRGILTIVVDSSAFASRLRYLTHALLASLKKYNEFNKIKEITFLIAPLRPTPSIPTHRRKLSNENAKLLIDAANACSNVELKAVLLRLANHADQ